MSVDCAQGAPLLKGCWWLSWSHRVALILRIYIGRSGGQGFHIEQGSPTPRPRSGTGPWPIRNQAAEQEVCGGRASKASSAASHRSLWLALTPGPSPASVALPPEASLPPIPPHPPHPLAWKNCLPRNWSLVPKRLGTTDIEWALESYMLGPVTDWASAHCRHQSELQMLQLKWPLLTCPQ